MLVRKLKLGAMLALAAVGMSALLASTAMATPSKSSVCSNCHSGPNIPVTATLVSNNGTTATYNVSAPGAEYIAVFSGTTKTTQITGASGSISVPAGKTYTLYAVAGPNDTDGLGSMTVSPAATPSDTTAPVTTSNAQTSYVSVAAITLSATDAGSGVAATYYKLDGGAQTAGTNVVTSALGNHTLQFWSVDVAGNIEPAKTVSFSVTAPVPVDATAPVTTSDAVASYVSSASIKLTATDAGSGVAATYYKLDGGAQTAGTNVVTSALGNHTVQFWSVDVAGNIEAAKTVSFAVTAPVPVDATAPVTTSDAKATYVSSASIKLTATDAGSGVAATYYKLDGGAQTVGTTVTTSVVGNHTVQFWSVDVAGNIEAAKTVNFAVTAPVPPTPELSASTVTIRSSATAMKCGGTVTLSGTLAPADGSDTVSVYVRTSRRSAWTLLSTSAAVLDSASATTATWSIPFTTTLKGAYQFQARFAGDADTAASTSALLKVRVR